MKRFLSFVLVLFALSFSLNAKGISAKSAVVINGNTLDVLYSLNKDNRMPMASTTKIMTALLLCEYGHLDREITITREMVMVEGTAMGLREGDKISLLDLLYGLMLCSGNDSANAIAITLGGSINGFSEMMNAKVLELGLKNTNFVTPSGLDAENHYTSCYDLAVITSKAFEYEEFAKAVMSKSATVCFGNPPQNITISNHNKLLKMYDDVVGVKTGFTKKSGRCLVSASEKDGKFVIAVTLNDKDDWADHRKLLDIGLSSVSKKSICTFNAKTTVVGNEEKQISVNSPEVSLCVSNGEKIGCETYLKTFLYAPINVGETIGYRVLFSGEKELKRINIKSNDNINLKKTTNLSKFLQNLFCIFRSLNEG